MFRYQIILLLAKIVWSFNIETNDPAFVRPNVEQENIGDNSIFFGYEIEYGYGSDDALNFVVNSPKASITPTQDKIYTCPTTDFISGNPPCYVVDSRPNIDNSSGLTISVTDNLDILACYPNMIHSCPQQQIVPGFCYLTTNQGKRWNVLFPEEDTNENILDTVCPTSIISDLDLIFLLDGSSSLGSADFATVKDWVQAVAQPFTIEDGTTQLGVIQYSGIGPNRRSDPFVVEISLGEITNRVTFNTRLASIDRIGGRTFTAEALNETVAEFRTSKRFGMSNSSQVLVLLTDGRASDSESLTYAATYVRSLGIRIVAVGVGEANLAELQVIATGTSTNDSVYFFDNFDALNGIAGELREAITNLVLEGGFNTVSPSSELELGQKGLASRLSRKPKYFGIFGSPGSPLQLKASDLYMKTHCIQSIVYFEN